MTGRVSAPRPRRWPWRPGGTAAVGGLRDWQEDPRLLETQIFYRLAK
jgi:hypothetical protein